jgi:hypothetical protein
VSVVYGRPLSELDQVDWASLTGCFGNASDVLELLWAVERQEEWGYFNLFNALKHQGSVSEAMPHAIPYLLEIAAAGNADALGLLHTFAEGGEYNHDEHLGYVREGLVNAHPNKPPEYAVWMASAYTLTSYGIELYKSFLHHLNSDMREAAYNLCILFAPTEPQLFECVVSGLFDAHPYVRVECSVALRFYQFDEVTIAELDNQGRNDPDFLKRLTAAVTTAYSLGLDSPRWVRQTICDAIAHHDSKNDPKSVSHHLYTLHDLLLLAPILNETDTIIEALWLRSQKDEVASADDYLHRAIELASPEPDGSLSPLLKRMLRRWILRLQDSNHNYDMLVDRFGLPRNPDALFDWLQERES